MDYVAPVQEEPTGTPEPTETTSSTATQTPEPTEGETPSSSKEPDLLPFSFFGTGALTAPIAVVFHFIMHPLLMVRHLSHQVSRREVRLTVPGNPGSGSRTHHVPPVRSGWIMRGKVGCAWCRRQLRFSGRRWNGPPPDPSTAT